MAQVDTDYKQDWQAILRDILHVIAGLPGPEASFLMILDSTRTILRATGGCLALFEEPPMLISSGMNSNALPSIELFQTLSASFSELIRIKPTLPAGFMTSHPAWIVGKVQIGGETVGLLYLAFDREPELNQNDQAILHTLLDVMTIVAVNVRADARHKRLSRNQSEFTRIVSHDLRSPLTAIQGFASMLEANAAGELNEKQAHFVEKILSGISQMTALVDNIQDAGRYDPETGFYEIQRASCDLGEVVQRIVRNHLVPAEKQELAISVVVNDNVPIINADVNMIERAVVNLVDNAIKYSPNGCAIEVGVKREEDNVVLYVKDNGLGISLEHQKRLFERHMRIPRKEHKRVKGSGLGLFIVRSVALRHGGKAWAESIEGKGSTFFVSIPLNEENSIVSSESVSEI